MVRTRARSVNDMFSGAVKAQETETIAELKQRIEELEGKSEGVQLIPVENIIPLKLPGKLKQPRLYFNSEKMARLKDSIDKHDVLEPILLRPSTRGRYEIISGERRWRCTKELGREVIKAHVQDMDDSLALEAALIAHLLNEEISTLEQTESILSLLSLRLDIKPGDVKSNLYAIKNKQIRGKSDIQVFSDEQLVIISDILNEFGMALHSFVSNRLPMLNIDESLLNLVREGKLSPTNAVLINRQPLEWRDTLLQNAEELSKNELMALIRQIKADQIEDETRNAPIEKEILSRFKSVSKNKALLSSKQVQSRLRKIQKLLNEIESIQV